MCVCGGGAGGAADPEDSPDTAEALTETGTRWLALPGIPPSYLLATCLTAQVTSPGWALGGRRQGGLQAVRKGTDTKQPVSGTISKKNACDSSRPCELVLLLCKNPTEGSGRERPCLGVLVKEACRAAW